MAIYEYYCPTCRDKFQERRPMSQATVAVKCASGHAAERTISAFATVRAGEAFDFESAPASGGCCGGAGGCACSSPN